MPEPSRLEQEPLRGVHILLADDDPDSRPLLKTVLEYAGALVSVAFTGSGALRALHALRPDIVLCALVDGVECDWLIARLREMPDGSRPPAVLLSSRHDRRRAMDVGYGECLAKPVDPWELCRVIAAHARPLP